MQVRYRYRTYPSPGQQRALARAFGCARVVYNDCLVLRDACHAAERAVSRAGGIPVVHGREDVKDGTNVPLHALP